MKPASTGRKIELSFIIPAYNKLDLLRASLKSVLAQTEIAIEVIVVDDASQPPLKERLAEDFPTVRFIRNQSNRGPSPSRNAGLKLAQGNYVCFLDADDQVVPQFGQVMVKKATSLTARPVAVVCNSQAVFDRKLSLSNKLSAWLVNQARNVVLTYYAFVKPQGLPLAAFFSLSPSRLVMPKSLASRYPFNESLRQCEDWELALRLLKQEQVLVEPRPLVKYYFASNTQTHLLRKQQGVRAYFDLINSLPLEVRRHPLIRGFEWYAKVLQKNI